MKVAEYQLLPEMAPEAFEALKADIAVRGVITPIDLDEHGNILDGHHRFRAWTELQKNDPPPTIVRSGLSENEKRAFARKANVLRRHLTREQVQHLIAEQLRETPEWSDRRIASDLGVDHKTVGSARGRLTATGEIPQMEKTVGADGRARGKQQKLSPDVEALAFYCEQQSEGARLSADAIPSDLKATMFDAGLRPGTLVVFQAPAKSEEDQRTYLVNSNRLVSEFGLDADAADNAAIWLARNGWTIDDWTGEEGKRFRERMSVRRGNAA